MPPSWKLYELMKPDPISHRYLKPMDETSTSLTSHKLQALWASVSRFIINLLKPTNEPIIEEITDRNGTKRWRVYDPIIEQCAILDSPQEVLVWLEERYKRNRVMNQMRGWE